MSVCARAGNVIRDLCIHKMYIKVCDRNGQTGVKRRRKGKKEGHRMTDRKTFSFRGYVCVCVRKRDGVRDASASVRGRAYERTDKGGMEENITECHEIVDSFLLARPFSLSRSCSPIPLVLSIQLFRSHTMPGPLPFP